MAKLSLNYNTDLWEDSSKPENPEVTTKKLRSLSTTHYVVGIVSLQILGLDFDLAAAAKKLGFGAEGYRVQDPTGSIVVDPSTLVCME